jgi:hypothetical protein
MPARLGEEVPKRLTVSIGTLGIPHQLVRVEGKILRVLISADILGLRAGQLIPLLARYLTPSAGRALGGVNEYGISFSHFAPPMPL